MLNFIAALFLACLMNACQTSDVPKYFVGEQCSPQLLPGASDNPETFVPKCRCRQYRIDSERVGPVLNDSGRVTVTVKPIEKCNLLKGYLPADDTKLVNTLDAWRVEIEKWNDNNKGL